MSKHTFLIIALFFCNLSFAQVATDADPVSDLERRVQTIEKRQRSLAAQIKSLQKAQKSTVTNLQSVSVATDSLKTAGVSLASKISADSLCMSGRVDAVNGDVRLAQDVLKSRTTSGAIIAVLLLVVVAVSSWLIVKRLRRGSSYVDDVRRSQDAINESMKKLQEESVSLDCKLLDVANRQLEMAKAPDHTLVLELVNEVTRIEGNLSKMDSSVRGYKQLVQAKDRMLNEVRAHGYEVISLIGQDYNDGMPFQTRFVPDDTLPEGKRVITGMSKMQVNYNGKMIQAAQIVVSQNI